MTYLPTYLQLRILKKSGFCVASHCGFWTAAEGSRGTRRCMLQLGMQVGICKNSLDFEFVANPHELVVPCEFEFAPSKLDPTRSCQPISGPKLYLPFFNLSLCKKVLQSELVVLQQRQMKTKNTKYTPTNHSLHLSNINEMTVYSPKVAKMGKNGRILIFSGHPVMQST